MSSKSIQCAAIAILSLGVCACSTAPKASAAVREPAMESQTYRPIHQQLTESSSLGSDEKNARYEDKTAAKSEQTVAEITKPANAVSKEITVSEKKKNASIPVVAAEASVAYQAATVLFANGSAEVSAQYQAEINKIAKLAKSKNAHITVYGFASSRTRNTDMMSHKLANFKISEQRAENVAVALVRAGAPKSAVAVEALSDNMPQYQEVMPEGEKLNRRAEIYISY